MRCDRGRGYRSDQTDEGRGIFLRACRATSALFQQCSAAMRRYPKAGKTGEQKKRRGIFGKVAVQPRNLTMKSGRFFEFPHYAHPFAPSHPNCYSSQASPPSVPSLVSGSTRREPCPVQRCSRWLYRHRC